VFFTEFTSPYTLNTQRGWRTSKFRVHQGKVYASHTPQIFSLFCHHTVAATWLMSLLVTSEPVHKI